MSAVDMHLSLGQIQGGSQDDAFDSAIDIISWEWELSQGGSMHVGSGGGVGKVSVGDLKITKLIDRSSPIFTLMCCQGKHFENAELSARKAGGDAGQVQFHYLYLEKVMITKIETGIDQNDGKDLPIETIYLNFKEFEFIYTPQDYDGAAKAEKGVKFDIAGLTGSTN